MTFLLKCKYCFIAVLCTAHSEHCIVFDTSSCLWKKW